MLDKRVAEFMHKYDWDKSELIYDVNHHRMLCNSLSELSGEPEEIAKIKHMLVPGPIGDIPIHVFIPYGNGPFPVILHFPTGGFVGGGLGGSGSMCQNLAKRANSIVVLVDFHKAPEYQYPAATNDAYTVLQWVVKNGATLKIDANRIALSGDSAGANIAAVTSIRARDENGPKILLQLLLVPYIDLAMSTQSVKTITTLPLNSFPYLEWLNKQYVPSHIDRRNPMVSPFWENNLVNLPKTIVVTTEYDSHLDQGRIYAEKLKAAGNDVTYKNYTGMIHIFLNMESLLPEAKVANIDLANDIRSTFYERL